MKNFITNSEAENLRKRVAELINKSEDLKFLMGFFYFSGIRELYAAMAMYTISDFSDGEVWNFPLLTPWMMNIVKSGCCTLSAQNDNGDGKREVQVNNCERLRTTICNFLRPFPDVHKKHLAEDMALCRSQLNMKQISPPFISLTGEVTLF